MLFTKDNLNDLLELGRDEIAEFCDSYLNAETLAEHLERSEPFSRKELCRYLGVGESTLTGWLKVDRIPLMAKEAFMLPLVLWVLGDEIQRLRDETGRARILKNGDTYQICRFVPDECGEAIGEVVADKILDLQLARVMVAGFKALRLLQECDNETIQYALEMTEQEAFKERLYELRKNIRMCQWYAADYEMWRKQNIPFKLGDIEGLKLGLDLTPKDTESQDETPDGSDQNAGGEEEDKS